MRRLLWLVILLALPQAATAFDEPTGFRDMRFGLSAREIKEKAGAARVCSTATSAEQRLRFDVVCSMKTEISNAPVDVQLWLIADKLGSVEMSFKPSDYAAIRDAFIGRYGPVTNRLEEVLTDRFGNKLESEILRWDGRQTSITLRQYEGGAEAGRASLRTHEYSRLIDKRHAEAATR